MRNTRGSRWSASRTAARTASRYVIRTGPFPSPAGIARLPRRVDIARQRLHRLQGALLREVQRIRDLGLHPSLDALQISGREQPRLTHPLDEEDDRIAQLPLLHLALVAVELRVVHGVG